MTKPAAGPAAAGVRWPGNAIDATGEDLSHPIQQLLRDMELLEDRDQGKTTLRGGTPPTLQVMTAGATSLSKWMAALVGSLGGAGGVATAVAGFWGTQDELLKITYIGSASVLLSAMCISIAVIVKADVSARAQAMSAEYTARAQITACMLNSPEYGRPAPAPPTVYFAQVPDDDNQPDRTWRAVDGFTRERGHLKVSIGNSCYDADEIHDWITYDELVARQKALAGGNGSKPKT